MKMWTLHKMYIFASLTTLTLFPDGSTTNARKTLARCLFSQINGCPDGAIAGLNVLPK